MSFLLFSPLCLLAFLSAPSFAADEVWSLSDVERMALSNNPDLKSARANYEATSKAVGVSLGDYLPSVNVIAKSERTTLPNPSAGLTSLLGLSEPYTMAVISVRQVLFDFGKALSKIDASAEEARSAEQQALAVRDAVLLAVRRAFYDVSAADQLVEVANKSETRYEETHRRTEVLVRTGARPSFDLSQANVELSNSRLAVINAKNSRDLARIELLNLIGADQLIHFTVKDEPSATPMIQSSALHMDELTKLAMENRPELKSSVHEVEAARYRVAGEYRDFLPTLSLEGWYGRYLPEYPVELRDAWGFGIGATWNLFDGLKTSARVGELSSRLEQREALLEKEREQIISEVAAAYAELSRSESQLDVANTSFEFSKENLDLAKKRYDASVGTILELLVAESAMVRAEAQDVQAKFKHEIAIETLKIAVNAPLSPGH